MEIQKTVSSHTSVVASAPFSLYSEYFCCDPSQFCVEKTFFSPFTVEIQVPNYSEADEVLEGKI